MRFFNNAGPVDCTKNYCLNPLQRIKLDELESLIQQERYFILHAPRQTGKTSALLALMRYLNAQGTYYALYVNVEIAQSAREDVGRAMRGIAHHFMGELQSLFPDQSLLANWQTLLQEAGPEDAAHTLLSTLCRTLDRPLVLLLDEVDALIGDSLIALLRQLRAGYPNRPGAFPQTVVLCGVRDVRDYRIHSSRSQEIITGGSAFNIKAESIRLGNFSAAEVQALYQQHRDETGQIITPEAIARVWYWTQGQPWLVNAIGYEVTFRRKDLRDRSQIIGVDDIDQAAETLIQRRDTHLDQLTDKLREARVRRVIGAILSGETTPEQLPTDDVQYVYDFWLISITGQLAIANPIYQNSIPRELIYTTSLTISHPTVWYVHPDGRLDLPKLLAAFQAFFREHSEHWLARFDYQEAGPQLLMQAFLHRVVNGGGRIEREYGLGRMRTDLLVIWLHPAGVQKAVIELKLLHKSLDQTLAQGLAQTWEYRDRSGADEAHLIIFDRSNKSWEDKLFQRHESWQGQAITVWGM
jgi:hypothetical protein